MKQQMNKKVEGLSKLKKTDKDRISKDNLIYKEAEEKK
jgi:hypothetical protein